MKPDLFHSSSKGFCETKEVTNSSRISLLEFFPKTQVLRVTFKKGGIYEYERVLPEVFRKLVEAESIGSAFQSLVIGKYSYKKISDHGRQ